MAKATLKLEFTPGDSINGAFSEAIRIAKLLSVRVEFKFNDITCLANAESTVENGVKAYQREMKDKRPFPLAVA